MPARYEIKYLDKESLDPITRSGGLPNTWEGFEWPACGVCGKDLSFVLQVSHDQVDLKGNKALQVFACLESDEPDSKFYLSDGKANKVFLIKTDLQNQIIQPAHGLHVLKSKMINVVQSEDPPIEEMDPEHKEFKKSYHIAFIDKFYGVLATGGDDPKNVKCSVCSESMVPLGQLMKLDLNGHEDFFISILKICPNGHEASYQAVRG